MDPQEIISRLGVDAVLLPIRRGTKAPCHKGWQNTTFLESQSPDYQARLARASAIGVLLGEPSLGLCSIDFDCPTALDIFLAANPLLQTSLRTTGKRGANVWVIVNGPIPRTKKLTSGGKPIGEWRAKGSHTLIAGKHPEGGTYSRTVDAAPVCVNYSEIVWPSSESPPPTSPPPPLSEESMNSKCSVESMESVNSVESIVLYPNVSLGDKIRSGAEAREKIKQDPRLNKLYEKYIEQRFSPAQGKRNSDLITMVTFLSRTVGHDTLLKLVAAFHDVNQDVFLDSRMQHMTEATAHLDACYKSWFLELSTEQQAFVRDLPSRYVEGFRICRDLAALEDKRCQPGHFFLSYHELAIRLGCTQKEAEKMLRTFESQEWLSIQIKGTQHVKGSTGKATFYQWLLPIGLVSLILMFSLHHFFYDHLICAPWFLSV